MPYEIYKVRGGYKVGKDNNEPMKNGRLYASESTSVIRISQFPEGYKIGRKDKKKLPGI